jgi:hypothetical protein
MEYYSAAICRRGHVETSIRELTKGPIGARCSDCGARILIACEGCCIRIRGAPKGYSLGYDPPQFCDSCGAPQPWASREARFYELENLLDEQDLDPADELKVRDELKALREHPEANEETEAGRWKIVQKLAPGLIAAGGRIVESVVGAAIKSQLGL